MTSRNEAWVWYDFFWRLHIMDCAGGDDFNGTLLRIASITAAGNATALADPPRTPAAGSRRLN